MALSNTPGHIVEMHSRVIASVCRMSMVNESLVCSGFVEDRVCYLVSARSICGKRSPLNEIGPPQESAER